MSSFTSTPEAIHITSDDPTYIAKAIAQEKLRRKMKALKAIREMIGLSWDGLNFDEYDEKDVEEKKPVFIKEFMNWYIRNDEASEKHGTQQARDEFFDKLKRLRVCQHDGRGEIIAGIEDDGDILCCNFVVLKKKVEVEVIDSKKQKKVLENVVADRQKKRGENCFTYNIGLKTPTWLNNEIMTENMKRWRRQKKEGILNIDERNYREFEISGKKWYLLVIQATKEENNQIDPLAFGVGYLVTGLVYWFKSEENRNTVANYVMK